MELKFNEAKTVRPNHLERCLCYDKFLKGYRCYVYDDISKYWCTQATTEHDPNGDNHIVDYADYQVTKWASLQQEQPEVDLDKLVNEEFASHSRTTEYGLEVTYNHAELYQLIKRMALVFNARKEELKIYCIVEQGWGGSSYYPTDVYCFSTEEKCNAAYKRLKECPAYENADIDFLTFEAKLED